MEQQLTEDQHFEKTDFTKQPLPKGEYEYCRFTACDFSNTDLSNSRFLECVFTGCNLSLTKLAGTSLQGIRFIDCKMLGLHFETCNPFGFTVAFDNCILDHSSFYKAKIKKTVFKNSRLQEMDFTEADLSGAVFDNCDLTKTAFVNTLLEKADFRTASNYSIDPESNRIKKARFSLTGLPGLLDRYDIVIG